MKGRGLCEVESAHPPAPQQPGRLTLIGIHAARAHLQVLRVSRGPELGDFAQGVDQSEACVGRRRQGRRRDP